jgi:predicted secreted protein
MPTVAPDTTTKAVAGKGTAFSIQTANVSGTITYTGVAELKQLNFSGSKNDFVDVTNFDSASRFKEKIVTLADAGDVAIAGNYVSGDTGQAALRAAFVSGATLSFKIVLPLQSGQTTTGETWIFLAFVSELDNSVQYDKALEFSGKLTLTGPITVTPGT